MIAPAYGFYQGGRHLLEKPRSRAQYDLQNTVSGLPGMSWLADYHRSSELREKTEHTWGKYGISFNDVKYPWLSYASSPMRAVVTGVSRNAMTLYAWSRIPKRENYYSDNYDYRDGAYYRRY